MVVLVVFSKLYESVIQCLDRRHGIDFMEKPAILDLIAGFSIIFIAWAIV